VDFDEHKNPSFNFKRLHTITQTIIRSMEKVITRNFYPIPETHRSNMRHRPIGVGIQGLADAYILMRFPYESPEAAELNRAIAETIYHASMTASMQLAREREDKIARIDFIRLQTGVVRDELDRELRTLESELALTDEERDLETFKGAYSTFATSPAARGVLQFDMWGVTPTMYDWGSLKENIKKYGIRHSVVIALMPTASTSQIMGMTESFEAITSHIYQRRTRAGEFTVINKYLIRDLIDLGIWSLDLKNRILASGGSIQDIPEIPTNIRALYKTVWEIKQKSVIDQSADRGPFVCHTQSLNLYLEDADIKKLTNMHFYGWSKGLKTGLYYLRTRPKAKTMSFNLDPNMVKRVAAGGSAMEPTTKHVDEPVLVCRKEEGCVMCSA
jgi:ribonucleotide reductase alpha subunit